MLSQCNSCERDVGFFSLQDKLCGLCFSENAKDSGNKLSRAFSFSTFWGVVFVLGFPGHLVLIYSTSRVDEIMDNQSVYPQALFSSVILIIALASALIAFIVRYYLVRRRVHVAIVAVFGFLLLAIYSVLVGVAGDGVLGITTLAFIFFPCYILRTPNIVDKNAATKKLSREALGLPHSSHLQQQQTKLSRLILWYDSKTNRQVNVLRLTAFLFAVFPVVGWLAIAPWLVPLMLYLEYHRVPKDK